MTNISVNDIMPYLVRLTEALERLAPKVPDIGDLKGCDAYLWQADSLSLLAVENVNYVDLSLLLSVESQRQQLYENTLNFSQSLPANNALLWGARGTGKSSLVKAVHGDLAQKYSLKLIEINRDDIASLPILMHLLKDVPYNCILFCDDLSFESDDTSYKSLKAVLEGGIEGRPKNIIFYATSNRRHMMPRDMVENQKSSAINPYEDREEKISLSDRFGLWLGFHNISQDDYMAMIENYIKYYKLPNSTDEWQKQAIEWTNTRGNRSGRVAWQFIQHLAGRLKCPL